MSKVIPLFKRGDIQDVICEAADQGLVEVVIIGKKADGNYWIRLSPTKDTIQTLGMVEMLKHDLIHVVEENPL